MNELRTAEFTLNDLPARGNYTLLIALEASARIKISDLGEFSFERGYYAYTGSAIGNGAVDLKHRVARHLRQRKTMHWHIDYLLANQSARVTAVIASSALAKWECQINRSIQSVEGAFVPVAGFGASDCRQGCGSHLAYLGRDDALEKIVAAHRRVAGEAGVLCLNLKPDDKQTGGKQCG